MNVKPNPNDLNVVTKETPKGDADMLTDRIPGVPEDVVSKWVEQYDTVVYFYFLGNPYVCRGFSWQEFLQVQNEQQQESKETGTQPTDFDFKMKMVQKCTLWPTDFIKRMNDPADYTLPGGLPLLFGEYITVASGFADLVPDVVSKEQSAMERLMVNTEAPNEQQPEE